MAIDDLSAEFQRLHDAWGDAIRSKHHAWFERHFAEDFLGTAQPWPALKVDKRQMIELAKSIDTMDAHWIEVEARLYGDTVLIRGVVRYDKEEFRPGATIGENMPTGDQLSGFVNGRKILYVGGWRRNGQDWQIFDHHMVGVVG